AEPRALRVAGEADADTPRGTGARLLTLSPLVVAQERERALEGRGEVAGVVRDGHTVLVREAGAIRHLGGAHEVAPADLGRVEAELARADVHQALHDEHGLGPSGSAIGRVQRLRGDHARADVPVVRHAIRAGQVVHRVRGEPVALPRIGADVGDARRVRVEEAAVAREADAHVVSLLAVL